MNLQEVLINVKNIFNTNKNYFCIIDFHNNTIRFSKTDNILDVIAHVKIEPYPPGIIDNNNELFLVQIRDTNTLGRCLYHFIVENQNNTLKIVPEPYIFIW